VSYKPEELRRRLETELLRSIADRIGELEELLRRCSDYRYEDPIYRFYHQSFKVYYVQETTKEIVEKLQSLAPELSLNDWFLEIVRQGTGKEFAIEDNNNWTTVTRPIVEAFLHARYFLEMVCKYGKKFSSPPNIIPSGWAAVLYLYDIR
jgi:hypothetical protein